MDAKELYRFEPLYPHIEVMKPEELAGYLNHYLAAATEAILIEGGTIDKFLGDAIMA